MRALIFALLGVWLLGTGCREAEAPPYERLHTRLKQDVFSELATGHSERAARLSARVQDLCPDEPFFALAAAREHDRGTISALNAHLRAGRVSAASDLLKREAQAGGLSAATAAAQGVCEGCLAIRDYLAELPFSDADAAAEALAVLEAHTGALASSEAFRAWHSEQRALVAALDARQRAVAAERLVAALDRAAVSGRPDPQLLLSQLTELSPSHPLLVFATADAIADVLADATLAEDDGAARAAEIAICCRWLDFGPADRKRIATLVRTDLPPATLCGLLLRALSGLEQRDADVSIRWLRELAGVHTIGSAWVALFMESAVLPQRQFTAGCWRTPFPAVPDLLSRLIQMRETQLRQR